MAKTASIVFSTICISKFEIKQNLIAAYLFGKRLVAQNVYCDSFKLRIAIDRQQKQCKQRTILFSSKKGSLLRENLSKCLSLCFELLELKQCFSTAKEKRFCRDQKATSELSNQFV